MKNMKKRNVIRSALTVAAAVALGAMMALAPGCQIEARGNTLTIRPVGAEVPVWKKVGCFVLAGRLVCLVDTNGDGVADLIRDSETGQFGRIYDAAVLDWLESEIRLELDPQGSPVPGKWIRDLDALFLDGSGSALPAFDFEGHTAQDWIASEGLDVPAGALVELANVRAPTFDPRTLRTSIEVRWSSRFALPPFEAYGVVNDGSFALPGADDHDEWFVVLRLSGHAADVAAYLAALGAVEVRSDVNEPAWRVTIDGGEASLYVDDVFMGAVAFEDPDA